jgi:hypothetical protein
MEIRIRATGQVMYESQLRSYLQANNGPSYDQLTPEIMEVIGVDPVLEGPQIQPARYQISYRDGVQQVNGQWFTNYSLVNMDAEQIAVEDAEQAKSVRTQRDAKLVECDWRVIKALESNTPQDFEWAVYRQALRDISNQAGFPWEITWPDAP